MRTTIAIDDHLLRSAKRRARLRGVTLGQLVEEALRRELSNRPGSASGPKIPVFRDGDGIRPDVDVSSTRGLLEALDEGQPLESTR